jgi:serine/threonine protein kinase
MADSDAIAAFINFRFDSVARYTIIEHIGSGGMGMVFLAQRSSEGVGDNVVLKTLRELSPATLTELKQEANLATRLRHPNIVRTYGMETVSYDALPSALQRALASNTPESRQDTRRTSSSGHVAINRGSLRNRRGLGRSPRPSQPELLFREPKKRTGPGLSFIVMDYVDGVDLLDLHSAHLQRGVLMPPILGAYIIARVARALEYAHNVLIHRDISPGNVMIDNLGMPLLSDFGVAVANGSVTEQRAGKLSYIAPELLAGGEVDERVDIYSLGMLAYLLATGITLQSVPREGTLDERLAFLLRQVDRGFPPLHEVMSDIPEAYSQIVARMIAANPDDRPPRAGVLANEIEQNYLYAHGFGPTNQSLASYIEIFDRGFDHGFERFEQLGFLRDQQGEVRIERKLSRELFLEAGTRLLVERAGSAISNRLDELAAEAPATAGRVTVERPTRPMIKVRFGDNCMESHPLESELVLGRSERDCSIQLIDTKASRRHARITSMNGGAVLEDLGSGNGTFVGDRRVQRLVLEEGTRFRVGETVVYFVREPLLLPPEKALDGEQAVPAELIERNPLVLRATSAKRHLLNPLWQELAVQCDLGERSGFLLCQALFEACGLVSSANEPFLLKLQRERTALRFLLWGPRGSTQVSSTLQLFKQACSPRDDRVELGVEQFAVATVRQVFDRIDIYPNDALLMLTKGF